MKKDLLARLRDGENLNTSQLLRMTVNLSIPAIMAQISSIVMQYIDAGMVGQLGAADSAAIGIVSSSTWLFGGICNAAGTGFTVQAAQYIGGKKDYEARRIMRQGLLFCALISGLIALVGSIISGKLPVWLGGDAEICRNAGLYFLVFALTLPVQTLNNAASGMISASGNMKVPSALHVLMCLLDVVFNALLIFPSRELHLFKMTLTLPGAGLGVVGAALGTSFSHVCGLILMLWFLLRKSPALHLRKGEHLELRKDELRRALRIAVPVACESVIMSGAQVVSTRIVSPLGTIAIAANSFSVTAESLCYMPGYGISSAASTLIGQSIGAERQELTRKLGWLTTGLGMAVMTVSGVLLYLFAPWMIGLLSPEQSIRELGTKVLRIEAFAEPLYGASIVAAGVFRGAGDTLAPSVMSLVSMWVVRLPMAALLSKRIGLRGVWIAMCIELCFRGAIFLARLAGKRWQNASKK